MDETELQDSAADTPTTTNQRASLILNAPIDGVSGTTRRGTLNRRSSMLGGDIRVSEPNVLRRRATTAVKVEAIRLADKPVEEVVEVVEKTAPTYRPLKKRVKYGFGMPQFAIVSLTLVTSVFIIPYYESRGALLASLAFYSSIARSLDVLTDPLMAWISDNTRSRFGRRKPYIGCGMWGFALALVLLFSPPFESEGCGARSVALEVWFGVFNTLFFLFFTLVSVPYQALGPSLSQVSEERTTIFFVGRIFGNVGTLVGLTASGIFTSIWAASMCPNGVDDVPSCDSMMAMMDMNETTNVFNLVKEKQP